MQKSGVYAAVIIAVIVLVSVGVTFFRTIVLNDFVIVAEEDLHDEQL